jgi:hypothetical protein
MNFTVICLFLCFVVWLLDGRAFRDRRKSRFPVFSSQLMSRDTPGGAAIFELDDGQQQKKSSKSTSSNAFHPLFTGAKCISTLKNG